jgi:hypothetical protein
MLNGYVTSCVVIAFYNTLLKERGMEELTGRRGRRYRQLLGDVKE